MIRSPMVCALVSVSLLYGCGGKGAEVRAPGQVDDELADLKAQRRRDRIRMRQMEERMARLAAERPAVIERPELPVERLVPAEAEGEIEVVDVTADGTEIVYADEAAEVESVAAPTDLLREPRRRPQPAPPTTARAAEVPPLALPAEAADDSLGTTTGRLPTIDQVTRQVTRAPGHPHAQAREPRAASRPRSRRPPVATTPAIAVSEYQRLVALVRSGDHAPAIAGLRRFVARYPESDYADNAQYWLGEAFYDDKKFDAALREFQRVAKRFPDGNKVSDALLKAAFCHINLGQRAGAIALLERLIAEHPDSKPAALARQKLERLRQ